MEWNSIYNNSSASGNRAYGYQYDELNQLTKAEYGEGTGYLTNAGRYNLNSISYDENGNILEAQREGYFNSSSGTIDDLTYRYKGNRLISVEDASTQSDGYHFGDGN
ncbi:MAG: hypothetical protein K9J13_06200 [Saprospiraceae bacterium]|nr:hypothetical protein [Saprospiraceae bacterium]